ncbi:hypothetical protein ABI59_22310 [Acidobacteria bacterium Mor1]|nr:hypothetical protein ABI59_22310 [Acidobacteria bacterium Mor1]
MRLRHEDFVAYYADNLGSRLMLAGDAARAEKAFRIALERSPGEPRTLYNFGTLLASMERTEEAIAMLKGAIRGGWDDANSRVNLGACLLKQGDVAGAREQFELALAADPRNPEARANLSRLERVQISGQDTPSPQSP